MNRSNVKNFVVILLLCVMGLSLCWAATQPDLGKASELENEFSRIQPPPGTERQGNIRRLKDFAMQLVLANYATDMRTKDLESYYDGVLKKNGWVTRIASFSSDRQFHLYCKGKLDAILDKDSVSGRYFFGVRRQQGHSLKSGCEQ